MLKKLQEAEEQLHRYEASAAPPGWSCHWDRYGTFQFYTNQDLFSTMINRIQKRKRLASVKDTNLSEKLIKISGGKMCRRTL